MTEHVYEDTEQQCWCQPELVQPHKEEEGHPSQYAFGWRHHYQGHTCECSNCFPTMLPFVKTWQVGDERQPLNIRLDGELLPSVFAFNEGPQGCAIIFSTEGAGRIHACETCFQNGCQRLIAGHVTVEWSAEVPA